MFWGVTLDAGKRYTQVVEKSFHLTMAALGFHNSSALPVTVMVEVDKAQFALCTLQAGKIPQQPLNYAFTEGEEVTFYSEGQGEVHLTGYLREDMEPIELEEELSEETTSESVYSETEEDNSDGDNCDSSDEQSVTLQGLLHGENEDSEESSSDEWDPSKNNPTKKRKKKTVNKKMKKKKHSFVEKSENENTLKTSDLCLLNELLVDEDDDDDDESWSPYNVKKEDSLEAKEKCKLKKKFTKFKQRGDEVEEGQIITNRLKDLNTDKNESVGAVVIEPDGVSTCSNGDVNTNSQNVMQGKKYSVSPKKNKKTKQSPSNNLSNERTENNSKKKIPMKAAQPKQQRQIIPGGISVEDIVVGQGKMAKNGQKVCVFYKGILAHSKKQFDTHLHGKPFTFVLGKGEVIQGWDRGIPGMKVGGLRKLVIPPNQGYGNKRCGSIPANSALEFEVHLLKVI